MELWRVYLQGKRPTTKALPCPLHHLLSPPSTKILLKIPLEETLKLEL